MSDVHAIKLSFRQHPTVWIGIRPSGDKWIAEVTVCGFDASHLRGRFSEGTIYLFAKIESNSGFCC